ncbi:hypothetical protein LX36DRAFT_104431 [Colletotrichum falcatum]|nr:hypothetical protein LX36DRAFT_104431 [Colletotrichum falcatum]
MAMWHCPRRYLACAPSVNTVLRRRAGRIASSTIAQAFPKPRLDAQGPLPFGLARMKSTYLELARDSWRAKRRSSDLHRYLPRYNTMPGIVCLTPGRYSRKLRYFSAH